MDTISLRAQQRGLTPEILEQLTTTETQDKFETLGITPDDIAAAVKWARSDVTEQLGVS